MSASSRPERAPARRLTSWGVRERTASPVISSNDFSLYDHVLDTSVMVGGPRKSRSGDRAPLSVYFAMARGADRGRGSCGHAHHARDFGVRAPQMTKWFNPNYRYMELGKRLRAASYKAG